MSEQKIKPTEQVGGATPTEAEAREKGPWAATASEGVVPAQLGGSDAPPAALDSDPELGSDVLGASSADDAPATEHGIDHAAGDQADATTDGGAAPAPAGQEPDLKDAGAGPREVDR